MGYYLANTDVWKGLAAKRKVWLGLLTSAVILLLSVTAAVWHYRRTGQYSNELHTLLVWVITLLIFMVFKEIHVKNKRIEKLWIVLGECSFGLYLIEDVVRNQIGKLMPTILHIFSPMVSCVIFVLLSAVAGFAVIYLVRKIPYVKKLI